MLTLNDIAQMAGVSKSTVSRYLNNGSVSQKTREKLDTIVKETGYQPNPFAQSLKAEKTNMIGVIIPRYDSPSTNEVLKGIDTAANKRGLRLIIMSSNLDADRTLNNIQTLQIQKVDQIILLGSFMNEELKQVIYDSKVPIILVGQSMPAITSLIYDDYHAGQLIAQHAIALNHKDLAFIGVSEDDYAVGVLRKQGFYDYAQAHGATIQYIETSFSRSESRAKALTYLPSLRATYIAAATDHIAMGIHGAATHLGYAIPDDFSLSGFGGYKATQYVVPNITTVNYPFYETGELAVEIAFQEQSKIQTDPIVLSVIINANPSTTKIRKAE
ncbi:LacI family DNA-binding transcriptional regulator [Aerococcaceae bacterium DSM 111020]|nr:LacI family DNA-binding transcriptional regulator [Aerococcaceae bacterium DSM 111020]